MATVQQRLGEYVLEERLAQGSFDELWRARHHAWADQIVAIKIPTDPQYVKNLQREGVVNHRLSHPNIVRAINFDPFSKPPYLVMEHVPGTNLREMIKQGPIAPEDAAAILQQVLAALHHAHHHGLVHLDIRPENILIHAKAQRKGFSSSGMVKLTDFGLGKAAIHALKGPQRANAKQLRDSEAYVSPEQQQGDQVDERADVYACGVILFEMLTGERPGSGEAPSDLNASIPNVYDDIYRHAVARLDERYATAHDFFHALEDLGGPNRPATPEFAESALASAVAASSAGRARPKAKAKAKATGHAGATVLVTTLGVVTLLIGVALLLWHQGVMNIPFLKDRHTTVAVAKKPPTNTDQSPSHKIFGDDADANSDTISPPTATQPPPVIHKTPDPPVKVPTPPVQPVQPPVQQPSTPDLNPGNSGDTSIFGNLPPNQTPPKIKQPFQQPPYQQPRPAPQQPQQRPDPVQPDPPPAVDPTNTGPPPPTDAPPQPVKARDPVAVPSASALAAVKDDAQKLIDGAKSNDQLIHAALESDNPAKSYLLFQTAWDRAVASGDSAGAFETIDQGAKLFQIDTLKIKSDAVLKLHKTTTTPAASKALAQEAIKLTDQAIAAKNVALAKTLATTALQSARASNDTALSKAATLKILEVDGLNGTP